MSNQHSDHGGRDGHDTTGLHGMLLFGDEVLLLSHLPMFMHPHNFQVLLQVTLDDAADTILRDDRGSSDNDLYTFAPERFPIAELEPNGQQPARTSIEGTIVRGHFERGGQAIATGAVAQIREVVSFRELDVGATPGDDELAYLCFGFTGRLHLVHQVGARPSFDQVLTGRIVAGTVRDQAGRRHGEDAAREHFETAQRFDHAQAVQLRGRRDAFDERLTPGETVEGLFLQTIGPAGSHGFIARLEVGDELYLERDELA